MITWAGHTGSARTAIGGRGHKFRTHTVKHPGLLNPGYTTESKYTVVGNKGMHSTQLRRGDPADTHTTTLNDIHKFVAMDDDE